MKEEQPETTLPTKANRSTLAGATYVNYEENTVELIDRGVDDTLEEKDFAQVSLSPSFSLPLSLFLYRSLPLSLYLHRYVLLLCSPCF